MRLRSFFITVMVSLLIGLSSIWLRAFFAEDRVDYRGKHLITLSTAGQALRIDVASCKRGWNYNGEWNYSHGPPSRPHSGRIGHFTEVDGWVQYDYYEIPLYVFPSMLFGAAVFAAAFSFGKGVRSRRGRGFTIE